MESHPPASRSDAFGIVLAGGRSRRLADGGLHPVPAGGKAAVPIGDGTFLGTVAATVVAELERAVVVAADGQPLPPLPPAVDVVRDSRQQAGPLAALRDGLVAATAIAPATRVAFVCGCDVPLLKRGIVRLLVDRLLESGGSWAVPVIAGHPQVLVSAVATAIVPRIEARLAAGHRDLRGLVAALAEATPAEVVFLSPEVFTAVDPGFESFIDVDTPADLARLVARGIPPSAR